MQSSQIPHYHGAMKWLRWILPALILIALTGCGVRSIYGNLDWLAMRAVNDLVSLDDTQQDRVRERLAARLEWHCATQLPAYAELLREMEQDLEKGQVGKAILRSYGQRGLVFWQDLQAQIPDDLTDLLADLDDAQVEELLGSLDERIQERRDDLVASTSEELSRDRARSLTRQLRRFFGRLNPEQRARVDQWSQRLEPTGEVNLDRREAWQDAFADALGLRHQEVVFREEIRRLFLASDNDWPADYREAMERNRDETIHMLVDLHELASPRQRNRLTRRIGSLADDAERLACPDTNDLP